MPVTSKASKLFQINYDIKLNNILSTFIFINKVSFRTWFIRLNSINIIILNFKSYQEYKYICSLNSNRTFIYDRVLNTEIVPDNLFQDLTKYSLGKFKY